MRANGFRQDARRRTLISLMGQSAARQTRSASLQEIEKIQRAFTDAGITFLPAMF